MHPRTSPPKFGRSQCRVRWRLPVSVYVVLDFLPLNAFLYVYVLSILLRGLARTRYLQEKMTYLMGMRGPAGMHEMEIERVAWLLDLCPFRRPLSQAAQHVRFGRRRRGGIQNLAKTAVPGGRDKAIPLDGSRACMNCCQLKCMKCLKISTSY